MLGLRADVMEGSLVFSGTADESPDSLNRTWILWAAVFPGENCQDNPCPDGPILVCDSRQRDAAGNLIVYLLNPDANIVAGWATLEWTGRRFRLVVPLLGTANGEWRMWAFDALTHGNPYTEYAGTFLNPVAAK